MASYSGLWNGVHGGDYALQTARSPLNRALGRVLKRRSMIRLKEAIDRVAASSSINGAAAVNIFQIDSTATPGSAVVNGGVRTVNTVARIAASQSTTSADAANVDEVVAFENQPQTYPTDASGNGGGGRSGKLAG